MLSWRVWDLAQGGINTYLVSAHSAHTLPFAEVAASRTSPRPLRSSLPFSTLWPVCRFCFASEYSREQRESSARARSVLMS